MKYVFIEKHQAEFSIKAMCRVLRVARSGWYARRIRRLQLPRQQFRRQCDKAVSQAFHQRNSATAHRALLMSCANGWKYNIKTVAASLKRQGLRPKPRVSSVR